MAELYRSIALLNTLGKALEIILAHCFNDLAEAENLLPPQQIGAQKRRSTETALKLLIELIHTVWDCNRKNMVSLLSFDVAEAFNHASHPQLLHNLQFKGIPEYMIKWTETFLSNRSTSLTIGRRTSEIFTINTRIPQDSPILPIFFLFYNVLLIKEYAKSGLKVQVRGFMDNVHLMAYGKSIESNCNMLEKAYILYLRWVQRHGALSAPKKYELIHLTRSPKRFNLAATVNLGKHQITPKV